MSRSTQLKVYLAGPMFSSGRLTENMHRAMAAAGHLIAHDFAVFLPQLYVHQDTFRPEEEEVWLRQDRTFLEACDVVFRLPGYSKGADLEEAWAKEAGIPVFHDWHGLFEYRDASHKSDY